MAQLRYEAGRINNPNVHKVGIIALGSHLENHGPALPIDTDAKIGSYIALQSALESGAKFLGVVFPAHELDEIDHGIHVSLEELKKNLIETLKSAKKYLDIEKVVIVNSHGGNTPIMAELADVEDETDITIIFNNKVISTEGPHGGSGELSMGKVLGILNEDEVDNQTDLEILWPRQMNSSYWIRGPLFPSIRRSRTQDPYKRLPQFCRGRLSWSQDLP